MQLCQFVCVGTDPCARPRLSATRKHKLHGQDSTVGAKSRRGRYLHELAAGSGHAHTPAQSPTPKGETKKGSPRSQRAGSTVPRYTHRTVRHEVEHASACTAGHADGVRGPLGTNLLLCLFWGAKKKKPSFTPECNPPRLRARRSTRRHTTHRTAGQTGRGHRGRLQSERHAFCIWCGESEESNKEREVCVKKSKLREG